MLFNAAICGIYSIADGAEDVLQSWKAALMCQSWPFHLNMGIDLVIISYWLAAIGTIYVSPVSGVQSLHESHFAGMASQRILHRSSLNQLSLESPAELLKRVSIGFSGAGAAAQHGLAGGSAGQRGAAAEQQLLRRAQAAADVAGDMAL